MRPLVRNSTGWIAPVERCKCAIATTLKWPCRRASHKKWRRSEQRAVVESLCRYMLSTCMLNVVIRVFCEGKHVPRSGIVAQIMLCFSKLRLLFFQTTFISPKSLPILRNCRQKEILKANKEQTFQGISISQKRRRECNSTQKLLLGQTVLFNTAGVYFNEILDFQSSYSLRILF